MWCLLQHLTPLGEQNPQLSISNWGIFIVSLFTVLTEGGSWSISDTPSWRSQQTFKLLCETLRACFAMTFPGRVGHKTPRLIDFYCVLVIVPFWVFGMKYWNTYNHNGKHFPGRNFTTIILFITRGLGRPYQKIISKIMYSKILLFSRLSRHRRRVSLLDVRSSWCARNLSTVIKCQVHEDYVIPTRQLMSLSSAVRRRHMLHVNNYRTLQSSCLWSSQGEEVSHDQLPESDITSYVREFCLVGVGLLWGLTQLSVWLNNFYTKLHERIIHQHLHRAWHWEHWEYREHWEHWVSGK